MPSNKILEQKKQVVEDLAAKLQSAAAGVLVKYEGIKVAEELSGVAPLKGYIPYHFTLVKHYEIEPIIAKYKKKIKVLKKQLKSLGVEEF